MTADMMSFQNTKHSAVIYLYDNSHITRRSIIFFNQIKLTFYAMVGY